MNIKVQCCGLVLLVVLFIFYSNQKKLYLLTEKVFIREFATVALCLLLDILSIVALVQRDKIPMVFVYILCKAYLVSLIAVALGAILYVCTDIYKQKSLYEKERLQYLILFLAASVMVFVLPIKFNVETDGGIYTYGPSIYVTYATVVLMVVIILFQIHMHKGSMNPDRRKAVILWMGLWLLAALVQFVKPEFLIVGFASAIAILVLYIKLENPGMHIDRKTGLFNQNALIEYIYQKYCEKKPFAILTVKFDDRNGDSWMDWETMKYLLAVREAFVFRKSEGEIVFLFHNVQKAKEQGEKIFHSFYEKWKKKSNLCLKSYWRFITNSDDFDDIEDLFYFMQYMNMLDIPENEFIIMDKEMITNMYKERKMEKILDEALREDRVEVYYQPIYSIEQHCFTAAEALVRITDREGKIVPPLEFIPIAEKTGKILKLGKKVFEKVCRFIKENHIQNYGIQYIEVNLSVVQCADERLAATFIEIMQQYEVSPEMINLEITESASLNDKKTLLDNMENLIHYGVAFSLDDFGTGQSNLNYIVEMPVELVKFDREMLKAYFDNGKAKYVMDAAMHMICGMGLKIVSEGIETEKQYRTMEELGISYIQGYYFSKPLPQNQFLQFIKEANG